MYGIVITSTNKADIKLLIDLAKRIGLSYKILSNNEIEEAELLKAMEEGQKSKFVSEDRIMKKLKRDTDKTS